MDILLFEFLFVDAVAVGMGADIADGGAGGLLHDVAQLAREQNVALALHRRDFDGERRAPHRRPGKPGGGAHFVLLAHLVLAQKALGAEEFFKVLPRDGDTLSLLVLGDAHGGLPAHGADGALQRTHARFHRVAVDHLADRPVRDAQVFFGESVFLALFGHEIALCDLLLLLRGVARKFDNLHAVAKGPGDGVERVRRRDEHDFAQIVRNFEVSVAEGGVLLGV